MLSIGNNKKLGKTIAVFNLPARKTCPGATAYCGRVCYAMKAERMYKGARKMRARNYETSLSPDFAAEMTIELLKFKGTQVRIHESGDFYSQEYLDKWIQIANADPSLTFLAYTKMYDRLDFSNRPKNLVIYASFDPTTAAKIGTAAGGANALHECLIVDPGETNQPITWYSCAPVSKTHRNYCGTSCTVCWAGSNNVIFQKH